MSTSKLSMQVVVHPLEETLSQIHVSNRVNGLLEIDASWHLAISLAPEMLDSLQVPLVYYCNNCLTLTFINCSEEVLVSLVDKYFFNSWEEHLERLNVPVYEILIQTFLRENSWASLSQLLSVALKFKTPVGTTTVLDSSEYILREVHSRFMIESFVGNWIYLCT